MVVVAQPDSPCAQGVGHRQIAYRHTVGARNQVVFAADFLATVMPPHLLPVPNTQHSLDSAASQLLQNDLCCSAARIRPLEGHQGLQQGPGLLCSCSFFGAQHTTAAGQNGVV